MMDAANGQEKAVFDKRVLRLIDIFGSICLLILASPLFIIIPFLIRIDSPGNVFFIQERLGLDGEPFKLIKFRTMFINKSRGIWTVKNDPRITRVGKLLRPFHLDELPQLINVLRGDLSMVGPRPYTKEVHDLMCRENPDFALRLHFQPGLTGWAQLSGRNGDNTLKDHLVLLKYDMIYFSSPITIIHYKNIIAKTIRYVCSNSVHKTF